MKIKFENNERNETKATTSFDAVRAHKLLRLANRVTYISGDVPHRSRVTL